MVGMREQPNPTSRALASGRTRHIPTGSAARSYRRTARICAEKDHPIVGMTNSASAPLSWSLAHLCPCGRCAARWRRLVLAGASGFRPRRRVCTPAAGESAALVGKRVDLGVTNIRRRTSSVWRPWLWTHHPCLIPFTSFAENEPAARRQPAAGLVCLRREPAARLLRWRGGRVGFGAEAERRPSQISLRFRSPRSIDSEASWTYLIARRRYVYVR